MTAPRRLVGVEQTRGLAVDVERAELQRRRSSRQAAASRSASIALSTSVARVAERREPTARDRAARATARRRDPRCYTSRGCRADPQHADTSGKVTSSGDRDPRTPALIAIGAVCGQRANCSTSRVIARGVRALSACDATGRRDARYPSLKTPALARTTRFDVAAQREHEHQFARRRLPQGRLPGRTRLTAEPGRRAEHVRRLMSRCASPPCPSGRRCGRLVDHLVVHIVSARSSRSSRLGDDRYARSGEISTKPYVYRPAAAPASAGSM